MKSNKIYIFLAMLVATLTTTACFDDQGVDTFFDGNQVEFNAANLPNGLTQSFVRLSPTQTDVLNVQVNRVSTSGTAAVTVNIEADPTSTAVEGVHYRLDSKSITIGAGEFITNLPITVLTGNIDPSETPDLVLNIASATGAEVSTNYGSLKVAIRVICPSELAGTYSVFWEYLQTGDGAGGPRQTATDFVIASASTMSFAVAGTGAYTMSDMSFGMYPGIYNDARPTGTIRDNCDVLTGAASNQDQYDDPFTISGVVNADRTITITWSNTWGDGGTVVLTKV
ncbi:MAG: hypothetical protein P8O16_09085 [Algoriphagus sp.]|uniref:hypothetical protein n=1 Tax=Algoriphagus sp. TaxID=1872435 RepID=UPI0026342C61|nr:hypothetical protein [Algoriphagus sp.]MDG1277421.1 hypothetical protein [Algoriphagus sp.]